MENEIDVEEEQSPNIQVEKLTLICGNDVVRGWQGVRTIE